MYLYICFLYIYLCTILAEANTEITLTCVVCLDVDTVSVVLRPCNHQCICETCWNILRQDKPICPMCRQTVISTLIIGH